MSKNPHKHMKQMNCKWIQNGFANWEEKSVETLVDKTEFVYPSVT